MYFSMIPAVSRVPLSPTVLATVRRSSRLPVVFVCHSRHPAALQDLHAFQPQVHQFESQRYSRSLCYKSSVLCSTASRLCSSTSSASSSLSLHTTSTFSSSIAPISTSSPAPTPHYSAIMTANMKEMTLPSGGATVITNKLEQPDLDNRSYRVIQLPNKLEALIVHDPDTDKASAALDVHVGNFSDSDDLPVSCLTPLCFSLPTPVPYRPDILLQPCGSFSWYHRAGSRC